MRDIISGNTFRIECQKIFYLSLWPINFHRKHFMFPSTTTTFSLLLRIIEILSRSTGGTFFRLGSHSYDYLFAPLQSFFIMRLKASQTSTTIVLVRFLFSPFDKHISLCLFIFPQIFRCCCSLTIGKKLSYMFGYTIDLRCTHRLL